MIEVRSKIESHRCWPLAVHEAAHAILGVLFGLRLMRLEIDLRSWEGSAIFHDRFPPHAWRQDLLVALAGELAQKRADPTGWSLCNGVGSSRAEADQKQAWEAVGRFNDLPTIDDKERIAALRLAEGARVSGLLVNKLWPTITALAEKLLVANGHLEGDSIERFLTEELPAETRRAIADGCEFANREPHGE